MSQLKLAITSARPIEYLQSRFEAAGGNTHAVAQRIVNFIQALTTGSEGAESPTAPPSIAITIGGNEVNGSGTFILLAVIATDVAVINGVSFTCVASGATGNQFNIGGTDTLTAVSLAAAINASTTALVAGYVTATSSGTTVTVTSAFPGLAGNQTLISSPDTTITASGARLTAGAVDATAKVLNF